MAKQAQTETLQPQAQPEPLYSKAELMQYSREIYKVKPEVIEGATYGITKDQFSKSEMQSLIDAFLKKGAK